MVRNHRVHAHCARQRKRRNQSQNDSRDCRPSALPNDQAENVLRLSAETAN